MIACVVAVFERFEYKCSEEHSETNKRNIRNSKTGHLIKWNRVLFSDESLLHSRLVLSTTNDSQHQLIWRDVGTRGFIPVRSREETMEVVLVWGGIMLSGWTVTEEHYCKVILPHGVCSEVPLDQISLSWMTMHSH
ncbi:hypothetical protein TNCV_1738311 [Trichonephila clavipes]|nr:hypothetical protein TNCV_1738311 [Trichonephila clavipes]